MFNRRHDDNKEADMTPEEQKELHKEAIKEAINEWLDKQYILFGKWTLRGMASAGLAMFLYGYAAAHGWIVK
jgi:hypothetical protein